MPTVGTLPTNANQAPNSPSYGSFGKTKVIVIENKTNNNECLPEEIDVVEDNDSGMSSVDSNESLKNNLINKNVSENLCSTSNNDCEVKTKCLTNESQRDVRWNEIPSCSTDFNDSNVLENENEKTLSNVSDGADSENNLPEFIVIDLKCDVNDNKLSDDDSNVGNNESYTDPDCSGIPNVDTNQSLVPINNEIANTENEKLLSLSLSILLAALLQAVRCFAQFLEDIVVPQR